MSWTKNYNSLEAGNQIYLDRESFGGAKILHLLDTIDWNILLSCIPSSPYGEIVIRGKKRSIGVMGGSYSWITLGEQILQRGYITMTTRNFITKSGGLKTLCHELAHSYCKRYENPDRTGFHDRSDISSGVLSVFLNEGITELIAAEIYEEYIKRAGLSGTFSKKYFSGYPENDYFFYIKRSRQFIGEISKMSGVSYDVAWEAIRSSYFQSEDLIYLLTDEEHGFGLDIQQVRKLFMDAGLFHEIKSLVKYIINPPL